MSVDKNAHEADRWMRTAVDDLDAPTTPTVAEIAGVLRRHFSPNQAFVFLFGSRANGTAAPMADWDIGILAAAPIPGRLMTAARDGLEDLPTLHRFDLVDFSTVSPEFRSAAMAHVVPLVGVMR
jgi:predicted nucleotidyltransferase